VTVEEKPSLPRPRKRRNPLPKWAVSIAAVLVVASWIPLTMMARGRVSTSAEPRYQFMHDMARQPRFNTQAGSDAFADGRAMRPKSPGTVARGELDEDDHYYRGFGQVMDGLTGKMEAKFFDGLPPQVKVNEQLLKRGQERYGIYCSACHGLDGYGNGPVNQRAMDLQEPTWTPAASFHTPLVRGRPDGHVFNTITNGIKSMPGYAAQIPVEDRWAIVAYVRALELSQDAPK
jgi:mono/diheme cytochrome c family protein